MYKKKIAILAGFVAIIMLVITGCYKTDTLVVNPGSSITTTLSFAKDINPVLSKNCALSGCHVSGGHAPDLTAANAYSSLSAGGYFKANDPDNSVIMQWLTGKKSPAMPLGNAPNATINANIYAWIKQGAQNN